MKIKLLTIALLAAVIGFGACGGGGDDKSDACLITSFEDGNKAGDKAWTIDQAALTIKAIYPKTSSVNNVSPTIVCSPGATVSPASGASQDFSSGKTVKYTVTAENGSSTKTYTASATVATQ